MTHFNYGYGQFLDNLDTAHKELHKIIHIAKTENLSVSNVMSDVTEQVFKPVIPCLKNIVGIVNRRDRLGGIMLCSEEREELKQAMKVLADWDECSIRWEEDRRLEKESK